MGSHFGTASRGQLPIDQRFVAGLPGDPIAPSIGKEVSQGNLTLPGPPGSGRDPQSRCGPSLSEQKTVFFSCELRPRGHRLLLPICLFFSWFGREKRENSKDPRAPEQGTRKIKTGFGFLQSRFETRTGFPAGLLVFGFQAAFPLKERSIDFSRGRAG